MHGGHFYVLTILIDLLSCKTNQSPKNVPFRSMHITQYEMHSNSLSIFIIHKLLKLKLFLNKLSDKLIDFYCLDILKKQKLDCLIQLN